MQWLVRRASVVAFRVINPYRLEEPLKRRF
jgi:hypothetical protein